MLATSSQASGRKSAILEEIVNEPINILIVDDEEKNLTVLESILDLPSYRLVRADSADKALLALVAEEFALLILDVRMPNMTGFELAQVIKQRKKTASVPIIFLTAYYNEDQHVLEGYKSGAVDYLHKPINASVLRSKVAAFAELHRKTRELQAANEALKAEVDARCRVQAELRGLNETLEERVLQRTEDLQRSEEKFRVIFNSTFQFIGLLDANGTVLEVNQTALATWGAEAHKVIGNPFWEGAWWRCFPGERDRVHSAVMRATTGEFVRFEAKYLLGDNSEATMDFSISPVLNEQGQVILLVPEGRDITAMKKSEQAMLDVDRRRNEFLAVLAHELRNPLAPVRNAIQVLGMKNELGSDLEWAVTVIDRQIEKMARLIEDLMDVSRINQGKIELRREPVLLEKIVTDAVESSRSFIAECGHELQVNLPPTPLLLDADAVRLSQSLLNILNNAAKYTENGGRIELNAKQHGSEVLVSVKDTGVGIPADKLNTIFEMFTQVEGTLSRSNGGLGIGLSIVKRLVEMHGGTITCSSAGPGTGSEFIIRLPLAVGEQRIPQEIESPAQRRLDRFVFWSSTTTRTRLRAWLWC